MNTCDGANEHRNYNFSGMGIIDKPKLLWKYEPGSDSSGHPIATNELVFMGCDNGSLHAVDAISGKRKWVFETDKAVSSTPAYAEGIVYFASRDRFFYALSASTGALVWKFEIDTDTRCSPLVHLGIVYFGAGNNFYAFDSKDGTVKWSFKLDGLDKLDLSPSIAEERIYVVSSTRNGFLYALDVKNGSVLWRFPEDKDTYVDRMGVPVFSDGMVCALLGENNLMTLDAKTGAVIWIKELAGSGTRMNDPSIVDGVIVCNNGQHRDELILGLNLKTGEEIWQLNACNPFKMFDNSIMGPPGITEGIAVVLTDHGLLGIEVSTGKQKWILKKESAHTTAAMHDGLLYFYSWGSGNRYLKAFRDKRKKV